jgi:ankyrin repeat protein
MSERKPIYEAPTSGEGGMTELHYGAYSGELDAVLAAIKEGIDVNARDRGDWTALHWLVDMGMVDGERERILDVLVPAGADIEARNHRGATPLMIACRAGNGDLVSDFLEAVTGRSRARTATATPFTATTI